MSRNEYLESIREDITPETRVKVEDHANRLIKEGMKSETEVKTFSFIQIGYINGEYKGICFFDKLIIWKPFKIELL